MTGEETLSIAGAARHMGIEHPNCDGCSELSEHLLVFQADYNSMCEMLAEPSVNQELRQRISVLTQALQRFMDLLGNDYDDDYECYTSFDLRGPVTLARQVLGDTQ